MGLSTGHSGTAQLLGFVEKIIEHPHIIYEKTFYFTGKILFYKWRKDWKDLCQNANSDFSGRCDCKCFFFLHYII